MPQRDSRQDVFGKNHSNLMKDLLEDTPNPPAEPSIFKKRRFRTRKDSEDEVGKDVDRALMSFRGNEDISPTRTMYPSEAKLHFGPSEEIKKKIIRNK